MLIALSFMGFGQRFKSSSSHVRFYSDAPMEDIEAVNEAASSLIDLSNSNIAVVIPIKSFDFEKELMEEHFNENYLESDKYPNAVFKGQLVGWKGESGSADVIAKGTLEMHGVTNEIEIPGSLSYENNLILVEGKFMIRLEDYKIKIPKAVFYNIAEEVEVTVKFEYQPYENSK